MFLRVIAGSYWFIVGFAQVLNRNYPLFLPKQEKKRLRNRPLLPETAGMSRK